MAVLKGEETHFMLTSGNFVGPKNKARQSPNTPILQCLTLEQDKTCLQPSTKKICFDLSALSPPS